MYLFSFFSKIIKYSIVSNYVDRVCDMKFCLNIYYFMFMIKKFILNKFQIDIYIFQQNMVYEVK